MAINSESTVLATFKVNVVGSDTKNHSVTFPNAKSDFTMNNAEDLAGTAKLFGGEAFKTAIHDVTSRRTFTYKA